MKPLMIVSTILGATILAVEACQSYSTVALNAVPAGANVRVALSDSGSSYVAPIIGSRAEELQGTVSRVDSASLTMSVSELTRNGGATELGEGKVVQIPARLISSIRVQSTSVGRSVLLTGVIAAGSILAGHSLGGGSGSSLRGGGPVVSGH
ncbi:MAG: hypothetical protein M3R65_01225 [Gemmatimonadota bacterium]|nr:hypothetical protein [Gemmatimonadota bacterium]